MWKCGNGVVEPIWGCGKCPIRSVPDRIRCRLGRGWRPAATWCWRTAKSWRWSAGICGPNYCCDSAASTSPTRTGLYCAPTTPATTPAAPTTTPTTISTACNVTIGSDATAAPSYWFHLDWFDWLIGWLMGELNVSCKLSLWWNPSQHHHQSNNRS